MSSAESQCGDAYTSPAPGQPAVPPDKVKSIEDSLKARVPDYEPGKITESAMLLNEIKSRLDARDPELFGRYLRSFTVTTGDMIQKGDTEEQIKEKIKGYDVARGMKDAHKFIEDEPDLVERFDALHKDALAKQASTVEPASTTDT